MNSQTLDAVLKVAFGFALLATTTFNYRVLRDHARRIDQMNAKLNYVMMMVGNKDKGPSE